MRHIGLFEGIGGFSYAARMMGWETIAWCEINKFCQKILTYHFPNAKGHDDIKTTDFSIYRGQCDIVTAGFPCQPFSSSGQRKGTDDDRYLWPACIRSIREIQPRYVVGENVRGLTNWNGGMVFNQVQADLEAEGFEVLPFLLPVAGVSLSQIRERIWFVAHNISYEYKEPVKESDRKKYWREDRGEFGEAWLNAATSLCRVDVRLSDRLDGITVSKWREESNKSYGNSVSPKVVYQIFKAIEATA